MNPVRLIVRESDLAQQGRVGLRHRRPLHRTGFRVVLLATLLGVAAVSAFAEEATAPRVISLDGGTSGMTLKDMKPIFVDFSFRSNPRVAVQEIVDRYIDLLSSTRDPEVRLKALQRLAKLEGLFGTVVEDAVRKARLGTIAVETYQDHLARFPEHPQNDWVLYHLARAHEMTEDPRSMRRVLERLVKQHPGSRLIAEAWFRIGELAYRQEDYEQSAVAFRKSLESVREPQLRANGEYMLAWTTFKQERMEDAADQFVRVLLTLQKQAEKQVRTELRNDVLRILGIIADYDQGIRTLHALLVRNRAEQIAPLVFDHHINFYLGQERYQDAAADADFFIERYPASPQRLAFHQRRIEAFTQGQFPTLVWEEKARMVADIGPGSTYWARTEQAVQEDIRQALRPILADLGRRAYAQALSAENPEADWRQAAAYLETFVSLFPQDSDSAEALLLTGEARLKLGQLQEARTAFIRSAWEYPDYAKRADAAWAALSAWPPDTLADAERKERLALYERFTDTFTSDPRAAQAMLVLAREKLDLEDHAGALAATQPLVDGASDLGGSAKLPRADRFAAWQIRGHAALASGNPGLAAASYRKALSLNDDASAVNALQESLAASLYEEARLLLRPAEDSAGQKDDSAGTVPPLQMSAAVGEEVVGRWLALASEFPGTRAAEVALYDAAVQRLAQQNWKEAAILLERYANSWPDRVAEREIDQKRVYALEQSGNLLGAADALLAMQERLEPEGARRAQFQAAELLLRADRPEQALLQFQRYLDQWPAPFDTAIEARSQVVALQDRLGQVAAANASRRALLTFEQAGGTQRSAASRTLASEAALQLARQEQAAFAEIPLGLPLRNSLARKRTALESLVKAVRVVSDLKVAEYVTAAGHLSGSAYLQLAEDILASERPTGLSSMQAEQYDLLLEEQAWPFEEKGIGILEENVRRMQRSSPDEWTRKSLERLAQLLPARYKRIEQGATVAETIL